MIDPPLYAAIAVILVGLISLALPAMALLRILERRKQERP